MQVQHPEIDYREALKRRLSVLPRQAVAWLVLTPEWPEELVALGFPMGGTMGVGSLPVEMLRQASMPAEFNPQFAGDEVRERPSRRQRPIVQASSASIPWEGSTFRIAPELRAAVVEDLLDEARGNKQKTAPEAGLDYLRGQLTLAAATIQRSEKLEAYPTLWRWAQLAARAESDEQLRKFLDEQVRVAIEQAEQRDDVAAPDALRWIEAAEFFADIFQGKLELLLTLARRRRELFTRRAYDRRMLDNYLRREDQLKAFHDLLDDNEHWALHYVGSGGLGKTMLLRYITHRETKGPNGQTFIATSRVDFDFLNPDYPSRAPGLLLSALATELQLQAGNEANFAFLSFESSLAQLNDEATRHAGEMRVIPLDHTLFENVIAAFASACHFLGAYSGGNKTGKVVLILDTCEELTKLRPDHTVPDNVRVTFDTLMRVHAMAPNVRVVFSGRRPLACKGFQWETDSDLPERDFLRLFVVEGFTEEQAQRFLNDFSIDGKKVPADFRDPILDLTRSTNAEEESRFRVTAGSPAESGLDGPSRHNPYDLGMYADWAVTNEELTVEKLRTAGPHFYVEDRIVRRLNVDIRKLLPQLALLGRFNRPLLEAMTSQWPDPARLLDEVVAQEWVRADRGSESDKWLIEARLRKRIIKYYCDREYGELAAARRVLADLLTTMTLERPFGELVEQYFSAAFEALQDEPERAAAWWGKTEERMMREMAWNTWGQSLTSLLLAEPIFSSEAETSFRAALLATEASAILHTTGGDVRATWQRAEAALPAYPASTGRARLEFRIQCGVQVQLRQIPTIGDLRDDPQCRGSWLAAAETLIERVEREPSEWKRFSGLSVDWLHDDPDRYVRAFSLALGARLASMDGNTERAADLFAEAATTAEVLTPRQDWLDWRAPDNLGARIELEFLIRARQGWSDFKSKATLWPFQDTIDDDRLWSALVRETEMGLGAVEPPSVTLHPLCNAHRHFPPLAVTLAEKDARNKPKAALELLRRVSESAKAAGMPDISLDADRAATRVIRRMRLMSENWLIPASVAESADPYDIWLNALTRALHMSGPTLTKLMEGFPRYALPETPTATWVHAEALMMQLDVAQLKDADKVNEKLCREAAEACEHIGDSNGVVICNLVEATWRSRTGKNLEAMLERLQGLNLLGFSWDVTLRTAAADDPSFVDEVDPEWRPWIARALAVCCRASPSKSARRAPRIVAWLKANMAVEVDDQRVLPLELAFLEKPKGVSERIGNAVGVVFAWGGVLFGFGVLAKVGWTFTNLRRFQLTSGFSGHNLLAAILHGLTELALGVGAFMALGGLVVLVQNLTKRFGALSWLVSPFGIEYRIEVSPESDRNRPAASRWREDARQRIYYIPTGWRSGPWREPIAEEAYRALRKPLGDGVGAQARMAIRVLTALNLKVETRISVDASSAGGPWEAILGMRNVESDRFAELPSRYSRTVSRRAVLAQQNWENLVNLTAWMYRGLGLERASRVWKPVGTGIRKRLVPTEILTRPGDYEQVRFRTGVALIFGSPIERSSEVFLGVGGVVPGEAAYWVSPSELQQRYPNMRLLILQAPPAEMRERTPTDRLQAAQMKRFGARAFECGIPAVLVVPPLPMALVDEGMNLVFDVVTRDIGNASHRLIVLARRFQEMIGSYSPGPAEAAFELAFDICLYVESRVNFRSRKTSAVKTGEARSA